MDTPVDPMVPRPFRVVRNRRETHDTFTLDLEDAASGGGMAYEPGQFNMLYVFGAGEVAISISGDPDDRERLVHTIRAVGSVTRLLQALAPGDTIGVRGPFGTAWPMLEARGKDVVIVSGGIGLLPLRPAVYRILAERERYGKVSLLVGARSPDDLPFEAEVMKWRGRFDVDVRVTVDRHAEGWHGELGTVAELIPKASFDPTRAIAMLCGPEIMMRFALADLEKAGIGATSVYVTMERNMKCAIGFCGHCQLGPTFVCKDGPVFRSDRIRPFLWKREA